MFFVVYGWFLGGFPWLLVIFSFVCVSCGFWMAFVFFFLWFLDGIWMVFGSFWVVFNGFWWFNGCIVQTVFSQKYFFKVYFSKVYGPKLFGFEVSSGSGSGRTWWPGLYFLLFMCYEFLQIKKLPRKMQIFAYQSSTNPLAILSQMAWPDNWKAITGEMEMREIMLVQTLISP